MKPAYVGIDVAFAKNKRLPVVVCTRENGRIVPLPLRSLRSPVPPRGRGNRSTLDPAIVRAFADETREYLRRLEDFFDLRIQRIAIDAPSAPGPSGRRLAEQALDARGFSCITTPTEQKFNEIRHKVKRHVENGGSDARMPHANQLWMLVGFELFDRLSRDSPCLEVFPNATVQVLGAGSIAKSQKDGLTAQLRAAQAHTGWPAGRADEPELRDICFGSSHDKLDAYLCAWVASLDRDEREPLGAPPHDVIWVPRIEAGECAEPPAAVAEEPLELPLEAETALQKPERVCPACKTKVFKRWPFGWDAHAAHRCMGLTSSDPEDRKREFKTRWSHLFRTR